MLTFANNLRVTISAGYIGAVAGRETEDFGLENSLQSNLPPVYVPYTVFDQVSLYYCIIALSHESYYEL